jgi:hypothetical protein
MIVRHGLCRIGPLFEDRIRNYASPIILRRARGFVRAKDHLHLPRRIVGRSKSSTDLPAAQRQQNEAAGFR